MVQEKEGKENDGPHQEERAQRGKKNKERKGRETLQSTEVG